MLTSQERCSEDELAATRCRFEGIVVSWALADGEVAALLGQKNWREAILTVDAETRMRLVIDIDGLLGLLLDEQNVADWIREPNRAFIGKLSPIQAMTHGSHVVRGIRNVLEDIGGAR